MSQELIERIELLEAENRRLRERENDAVATLRVLIQKTPSAAVALDHELRVLHTNALFLDLLDHTGRARAEAAPGGVGVPLSELLDGELCAVIGSTHRSGEELLRSDLSIGGVPYVLSVLSIRRGQLTIAIFRAMYDPALLGEEIAARLTETVDRNLAMIQQVASLLGEEISENAKTIASTLKLMQARR